MISVATCLAAVAALLGLSRSVGPVLPVAWLVVVPACFAGGLWVSAARRDLLCAWAALRAFGARVGLGPLLLGYATGYVSEAVPLPAGGAGGVDAAMTGGFVLAGAPLGAALLAAVTFRVFNFWLPALIAVPTMLGVRGLRDRLQEIATQRGHA